MIWICFIIINVWADECTDWFQQANIKKGSSCLVECASTPVDMGTFGCPDRCTDFCNSKEPEKALFSLSALYPGLTAQERALATTDPGKMLIAYGLSWKAESICSKLYPTSAHNDESDACRHFVWASLLVKEFKRDFAEKVLFAHEQEPTQPEEEKAMDLANNQRGMSNAEKIISNKTYSEEKIINDFKRDLKEGKLIILNKPAGKIK